MSNFSTRLAKLRKEKGLSQQELANLFEVSKSAIAMYETNRREPDNELLAKFASFFNVSIDYLLGFSNEPLTAETIKEKSEEYTVIPSNQDEKRRKMAKELLQVIIDTEGLKEDEVLSDEKRDYYVKILKKAIELTRMDK